MGRWFHGTDPETAERIISSGAFRAGTWFAKDIADAITFGGSFVFEVEFEADRTPLRWQIHLSNELPVSAIVNTKSGMKMREPATQGDGE